MLYSSQQLIVQYLTILTSCTYNKYYYYYLLDISFLFIRNNWWWSCFDVWSWLNFLICSYNWDKKERLYPSSQHNWWCHACATKTSRTFSFTYSSLWMMKCNISFLKTAWYFVIPFFPITKWWWQEVCHTADCIYKVDAQILVRPSFLRVAFKWTV